jgi:hypothetical protein
MDDSEIAKRRKAIGERLEGLRLPDPALRHGLINAIDAEVARMGEECDQRIDAMERRLALAREVHTGLLAAADERAGNYAVLERELRSVLLDTWSQILDKVHDPRGTIGEDLVARIKKALRQ